MSMSIVALAFLCVYLSIPLQCSAETHSTFESIGESSGLEQQPAHTQIETYSLDGRVLNSATGEPIRGALVQLSSDRQRSTRVGSDGRFHFEGLLAGQVSLSARKPGFFGAEESPNHANQLGLINIGPNTQPVVLKLSPEGVIFGRITDEDGEPVESLLVRLASRRVVDGRKQWTPVKRSMTNEDGEFRIPELPPGTYYLSAGPGRHSEIRGKSGPQPVEEGYPETLYPGVAAQGSATPIPIVPGKHARADFTVSFQPFYRVSGTVSGYPAGGRLFIQLINASGQGPPLGAHFDPHTGSFETDRVAPGLYTLRAMLMDDQGPVLAASLGVQVKNDTSGVHLNLQPLALLPVKIRIDSGLAEPPNSDNPATIMLNSVVDPPTGSTYVATLDGPPDHQTLAVRNLLPGRYSVDISSDGPWYVQSASCGGIDLLQDPLTVAAGGPGCTIEVVLRDDGATLSGTVTAEGRPARGTVLMIPERAPERVLTTVAETDGSFQFEQVAPGAYRVLAIESDEEFEYSDQEALSRIRSKARGVTVVPNQKVSVTLELVRPVK